MRQLNSGTSRLAIAQSDGSFLPTAVMVLPATTFLRRLVGLLGKRSLPDNQSLWLHPCGSIHTFGMRFTIDVVFVDKGMRVLGFSDAVPPNRIRVAPKGTASVLELSEGNRRRTGINLDDLLNFDLMDSQPNKQE